MNETVRIDSITVREISLPLETPFQISGGTMHIRKSLIVELESEGVVGYGESAPFEAPFYSEETIGSVTALYRDLYLPRLVGREFESLVAFDSELRKGVRGNAFARCGLENAYWDLCCARDGVSLSEAIERYVGSAMNKTIRTAESIDSGIALGIPEDESLSTLARWIEEALKEGYRRVKIKIRPGWDREPCRLARNIVGADFPIWTDANAAYDLQRDLELLKSLDEYELLFHEQPLHHDDLLDHSRLAEAIATPLCLDESLKSARVANQALELSSAAVWNIKVQRLGGLLEAIRVYLLAQEHDIRVWGGTMPESGIGAQAILALAGLPGFAYPADVEPSTRWYAPATDPLALTMTDGRIAAPGSHGVGEALDRDLYQKISRTLFSK